MRRLQQYHQSLILQLTSNKPCTMEQFIESIYEQTIQLRKENLDLRKTLSQVIEFAAACQQQCKMKRKVSAANHNLRLLIKDLTEESKLDIVPFEKTASA